MLKVDLHIHACEDKADSHITYSAKKLIDKAEILGFDALAFTFHHQFFWNKEIQTYAHKKGILLIPGSEMIIEGKDVLVYNITKKHLNSIKTFNDLRALKKKNKNIFVIAAHPYYPGKICLGDLLDTHYDLFDAIEYCWLHTKWFSWNKKAVMASKKYRIPLVATSDAHYLDYFGRSYIKVKTTEKTKKDIFTQIKKGNIEIYSPPLTIWQILIFIYRIFKEQITLQSKKNKYRTYLGELRCRNQL
ncbi:MAG: PHP domain-containing protein [Candidatus Woesearchaeota archaeon]